MEHFCPCDSYCTFIFVPVFLLYPYKYENPRRDLRRRQQREQDREFQMFRFVAENIHPRRSADRPEKQGGEKERALRYAPFPFFRAAFIRPHQRKRRKIDEDEIRREENIVNAHHSPQLLGIKMLSYT